MSFSVCKPLSWALLVAGAAALSACAPVSPNAQMAGRTLVSLDTNPDLQWTYWGYDSEIIGMQPHDLTQDKPLQAKVWQMRTRLGELVGVMSVRSNTDDLNNKNTVWTEDCPKQQGVLVERTQGLNVGRVDCLRIKRTANNTDWLVENDANMAARLEAGGVFFARPVSYVSYQFTTSNGAYVEVQVLVDQRLVRPETRNSVDFLAAGRPLVDWSQNMSLAVRQSTGFINGVLNVPPFPFRIDQKPFYQTRQLDSDAIVTKDTGQQRVAPPAAPVLSTPSATTVPAAVAPVVSVPAAPVPAPAAVVVAPAAAAPKP